MGGKVIDTVKYILTFFITAGILVLLLFVSVKAVPRENIRANMEKSAEYLVSRGDSYDLIRGRLSSRIDIYAD